MTTKFTAASFGASLLLCVCAEAATPMLNVPFDLPPPDGSQKPVACKEEPPAPVLSLEVKSRYDQTDKSKSTIDPAAEKAYQSGMKPVRAYLSKVSSMASRYVDSDAAKRDQAACAFTYLTAWAQAGALTNLETRQAVLSTTRIVAGLAMAYRQIKADPVGSDADRAAIDAWMTRLAATIKGNFSDDGSGDRVSNRQNHRYWAGFAVAAVGVATGSQADLAWGVESYRIGVCQVQPNGSLPLELARGQRARDYHIHATAPLVMIAELAEANGIDAYDICDGALHRLIKFDLDALADPAEIEKLTGKTQLELPTKNGAIRGDRVAWLQPYFTRFPEKRELAAGIKLPDRMTSTNLGGNLSGLFND
jgi:poly(beta-D-mannuronate) lyase